MAEYRAFTRESEDRPSARKDRPSARKDRPSKYRQETKKDERQDSGLRAEGVPTDERLIEARGEQPNRSGERKKGTYEEQVERLALFEIDPMAERPTTGRPRRLKQLNRSLKERHSLYDKLIKHMPQERERSYRIKRADIEQEYARSGITATRRDWYRVRKTPDGAGARNLGEDEMKRNLNTYTSMLHDMALDQRVAQLQDASVRDRIIEIRNAVDAHLRARGEGHQVTKDQFDNQIKTLLDAPSTRHEEAIRTIQLSAAAVLVAYGRKFRQNPPAWHLTLKQQQPEDPFADFSGIHYDPDLGIGSSRQDPDRIERA